MVSSFNYELKEDKVHIHLYNLKVDLEHQNERSSYERRVHSSLKQNSFPEYIEDFQQLLNKYKDYVNGRMKITLPWDIEEFRTDIAFKEHIAYFIVEPEPKAYEFLEEELWTDDKSPYYKPDTDSGKEDDF
jgi:hypothetical protein